MRSWLTFLSKARSAVFAVAIGACLFVGSAPLAAEDLGPAPASLIHDETHLFDGKNTEELSRTLRDAREKLGVSLYVAAYPFLRDGTVRDRALVLADQWSGEEPGLVIAFSRRESQAGIAASAGLWRRYPPDEAVLALADATSLLSKPGLAMEERVTQAVHLALERVAQMESLRLNRERTLTRGEVHLAGWFAAALMVFGGMVWLALVMWRRHEAARGALFFPDVEVGTRLGAPFGGGVIGVAGEEE